MKEGYPQDVDAVVTSLNYRAHVLVNESNGHSAVCPVKAVHCFFSPFLRFLLKELTAC